MNHFSIKTKWLLIHNIITNIITSNLFSESLNYFPDDEVDYINCQAAIDNECQFIGDSSCDMIYFTPECNYDGRDCDICPNATTPDDGFNYSNCLSIEVGFACRIGNSGCDFKMGLNTAECDYDAGDFSQCPFPDDGFDYSDCDRDPCWIGDDDCDGESYAFPECNNDRRDCDFNLLGLIAGAIALTLYGIFAVPILFF